MIEETLKRGAEEYRIYDLLSWVIMPNHIHIVIQPRRPLPKITRWLKGSTAKKANTILQRTDETFWQEESYDHCVRNTDELNRIIRYVERNPVRAGLSRSIETYHWSSASAQTEASVLHQLGA